MSPSAPRGDDRRKGGFGREVSPSPSEPLRPGDIRDPSEVGDVPQAPGVGMWAPEPVMGADEDTPLEEGEEPEGVVPSGVLLALKDRRHIQWHLLARHERHEPLRRGVGSGDDAVFLIDDGRHHAMVGREVGIARSGCHYILTGRLPRERADEIIDGNAPPLAAFDDADELALCGVVDRPDILSANVFTVERYPSASEVPAAYRVGSPTLHLDEDLDIDPS